MHSYGRDRENHHLLPTGRGCSRLARVLGIKRLISRTWYRHYAIEVPDSNYAQARVFPIIDYDGHHIPFDDDSFDIVFSSNVMEHICDLHQTNREIQRVLRSDGYCVHVIPTHSWRFWTTLSAFPTAFQYAGALKSQLLPRKIPKRNVV